MCRKNNLASLRSQLVLTIVPLFLIGELIVIAIISVLFGFGYFTLQDLTSRYFLVIKL